MQYLLIVVLIIFFLSVKEKKITNPQTMFSMLWLAIVILSNMGIMGSYIPSQYCYLIVFIGVSSFWLGTHLTTKRMQIKVSNGSAIYSINYKILILFAILTMLVLSPETIVSVKLLLKGYKLGDIHRVYTEDFNSYYTVHFPDAAYYLVVYPTCFSISILSAYDFWLGKRKVALQIATYIVIAMRTITYGGRIPLFYLLFFHLIGFLLYLDKYNKNKKIIPNIKKRKGFLLIIILGILGVVTILSRLINGIEGVPKMLVVYFSSCLNILDQKLIVFNDSYFTIIGHTCFGFYKTAYRIMDGVCKVLGISFNDSFFTLINNAIVEIENPVDTGISESNAFVTPYYYFYLDGWIFGVVVYSIAWGMLASYSYKKMKNDKELKDVYFYMIWMFTVFFSMVRSWLASPEIASAFLSYFIFVKKSNKKYMPS